MGGYFRFRFDRPRAWPALLLEPAIAFRCRFGVPYGDQGLFMRRHAYWDAGGHSPWPLFEEVALIEGLRRLGRLYPCASRSMSIRAAGIGMAGGAVPGSIAILRLLLPGASLLIAWRRATARKLTDFRRRWIHA